MRLLQLGVLLGAVLLMANARPARAWDDSDIEDLKEDLLGPTLAIHLYIDLAGSLGYANALGTDAASPPALLQSGGELTIATRFGPGSALMAGLVCDYRIASQQSAIDTSAGNFAASRFLPVVPMVGIRLSRFVLKGEYQLLGDYNLANKTAAGATVSYGKPSGYRGTLLMRMGLRHLFVGPFYESTSYSSLNNSQQGLSTLSPSLRIWQAGLTAAVVF